MANVTLASGTAYAELNWDNYIRFRPPYPSSLRDLVYSYHNRNDHATWTKLVDVGSGVGISAVPYMADFSTVCLLDPSVSNQEAAQVLLNDRVKSQNLQTKLEFRLAKADEDSDYIQDASIAICATAAHFIDPDKLMKSMSQMIQPGGTMAIYTYWTPVFPDQSPHFSVVFAKVFTKALRLCFRPGDEVARSLFSARAARLCAGTSLLDAIPVPQDLFEDVKRIRINPEAGAALKVYCDDPPVPCVPLPSQTTQNEEQIIYYTGKDDEAEGWCFPVTLEWLHGMISTILPNAIELTAEQRESLFDDFDKVFASECPSGSTRALWGVTAILGRRR